jgi:hypothetical protein
MNAGAYKESRSKTQVVRQRMCNSLNKEFFIKFINASIINIVLHDLNESGIMYFLFNAVLVLAT